jgi:branched-chain amino acid transport system permease protein
MRRQTPILIIIVITAGLLAFTFANSGSLGNFGITVLSGLFQGMLLFLVASGLSIVFGLMDILNLAQGTYFMIGAYVAYDMQHAGGLIDLTAVLPDPNLRFVAAVLGAVAVGGLLGVVLERGLLRPLYARPVFQLVLTFGVSLVLTEIVQFIWSTTPYSWTATFGVREGFFEMFGQRFSTYRLFVVGIGILLIVGIALLLQRTRIGIIIRAGVEDSEMVESLGINVRAVFTLVFTLGSAIAALGGAVAAPFLGASTSIGGTFLIQAIAVVVLGGMGSYVGTAVGSVMVGLAIAVAQDAAIGTNLSILPSITPMLLLVLILLVRPSGLFGSSK